MSMLIATDQFNIFEESRNSQKGGETKKESLRESKVVRVVAVLPRRVESGSKVSSPRDRIGSTDSEDQSPA